MNIKRCYHFYENEEVDILLEDIPTVPTLIVGFWDGYLRQNCCKIIKIMDVTSLISALRPGTTQVTMIISFVKSHVDAGAAPVMPRLPLSGVNIANILQWCP